MCTVAESIFQPSKTTFQLLEERNASLPPLQVALDFFSQTPCLPYGYCYNRAETIGTYLLTGGATAIEWLSKPETDVKHVPLIVYKIIGIALLVFTLPLTALGACIKFGGSLAPHSYRKLLDVDMCTSDSGTIDQIYEIFRIFSEVAEEVGLTEWFLYSGSALGEYLRNGVIPWDDDGDIALLKESLPILLSKKVISKLEERGVIFDSSLTVRALDLFSDEKLYTLRLDSKKVKNLLGYTPNNPAMVDIFVLDKTTRDVQGEEKEIYFFDHYSCQKKFPKEFILKEELIDPDNGKPQIEQRPFGPPCPDDQKSEKRHLKLNCLKQEAAKNYLQRTYGKTCLERGRTSHHHIFIGGIPLPGMPAVPVECENTPGYYAVGKKWAGAVPEGTPSCRAV